MSDSDVWCWSVPGHRQKHVPVDGWRFLRLSASKWRWSIAAAAQSSTWHWSRSVQCCTLPKTHHIHSDNWCYLMTSVVLSWFIWGGLFPCFRQNVATQSCTVLWVAVWPVSHLVRSGASDSWGFFSDCCCFREYTDQIGLTFCAANLKKARKFGRTFIFSHNDFSWDWVYLGWTSQCFKLCMYWRLQIVSAHCVWCWLVRYTHHVLRCGFHHRHWNPTVFLSGRVNTLTPPAGTSRCRKWPSRHRHLYNHTAVVVWGTCNVTMFADQRKASRYCLAKMLS